MSSLKIKILCFTLIFLSLSVVSYGQHRNFKDEYDVLTSELYINNELYDIYHCPHIELSWKMSSKSNKDNGPQVCLSFVDDGGYGRGFAIPATADVKTSHNGQIIEYRFYRSDTSKICLIYIHNVNNKFDRIYYYKT